MGAIRKIAIAVLSISFLVFVALFGRLPAFRKGPIGFLHRLIWLDIPVFIRRVDVRVTGGSLQHAGRYLMNENHPLVLILYLAILSISQTLFILAAWSRLDHSQQAISLILSALPHMFVYKCVTSTSSVINSKNLRQEMQRYPYDHVLFRPGHLCRTCQLLKPARSKHCSICNVCVAKHDHHCIWVMNCLGRDNYAYFLGMLLSLATLLLYGSYLSYSILTSTLQNHVLRRAHGMFGRSHWSVGKSWSQYFQLWAWAIAQDVRIGGVGMLALMTAPLAFGLFAYHVYLIWAGMTTNESLKWTDWKEDIADGLVFKCERPSEDNNVSSTNLDVEPYIDWPITSKQHLAICQDGNPPGSSASGHNHSSMTEPHFAGIQWTKVESLNEVENLYDLGFWNNVRDALFL